MIKVLNVEELSAEELTHIIGESMGDSFHNKEKITSAKRFLKYLSNEVKELNEKRKGRN